MRIAITGASGFVGRAVMTELRAHEHEPVPVRRRGDDVKLRWSTDTGFDPLHALDDYDAIVHLAGENIAGGRWNDERKARIKSSRVEGTRRVVEALVAAKPRPRTFVCMSAVGFYGPRGDVELTEDANAGHDFLAEVCTAWESEANKAEAIADCRVVRLRLGTVLGAGGGALAKMMPAFKLGVGGRLGDGEQYMSWIHIDDVVGGIVRALEDDKMSGAYNLTAPTPVTNADFTRALGRALHRPTFIPVPRFALKAAFGEVAEHLLLQGQRAVPRRLLDTGHKFAFSDLGEALADVVG